MGEIALRVEGLGKRYRIGAQPGSIPRYKSLRDSLVALARRPITALRSAVLPDPMDEANSFWALREISFEVKRGEVVGIIGRNGAGKSTLLKILSRITKPTIGRVALYGRVGSLLEVGTGFHPELTGRENIFLNGAVLGMTRSEVKAKFDEIIAFSEIEKFLDTAVKHYSSGMYMRLAFAVAAHLEPEILVVDEVLSVGDAEFQKKCLGKMHDVAERGRTVLFVSHNLAAVRSLCTRAIMLQRGRLAHQGDVAAVTSHYLDAERDSRAERTWPDPREAPGNDRMRLAAVRTCNSRGEVASSVDDDEPINVQIDYRNLVDGAMLGTTVVLYNSEGVCVFSSASTLEPQWHGRPRPEGLFRSTCHIPGNLLNADRYGVTVLAWGEEFAYVVRDDHVVEFEVQDTGRNRGGYFGHWAGVIRPRLDWSVQILGDPPKPRAEADAASGG